MATNPKDPWADFVEVGNAAPTQKEVKNTADLNSTLVSTGKAAVDTDRTRQLTPGDVRTTNATATIKEKESELPALTKGQEALDSKFAEDYVQWTTGGRGDFLKAKKQLERAITAMGQSDNISGPVIGTMPEWIRAIVAPGSVEHAEEIQEVAQKNLRAILGGQFAQKEGEQLIARAFNPKLEEKVNARRGKLLLESLLSAANAKEDAVNYFKEHGTLSGWSGNLPTAGAIDEEFSYRTGDKVDPRGLISPLTPREAAYETTTNLGDTVVSAGDQQKVAQLQSMFDKGATRDQIADYIKSSGLQLDVGPGLDKMLQYRDNFLQNGGRGPSGASFQPKERPMTAEEQANAEALNDPLKAFGANMGNMLSLGLAPDMQGLVDPKGEMTTRESLRMLRENSPWASAAGDVAGVITPTSLLSKGIGLAAKVSKPVAATAADVLSGAITGFGENPDNRTGGVIVGGGAGGLGALAGKYMVDPVTQGALDAFTNRAAKPTFSDRVLAGRIGNVDNATTTLQDAQRLDLPMGLADVSPEARKLAAKVARYSPDAADRAEQVYTPRAAGRSDRATDAVARDVTAPIDDVDAFERSVKQQARTAAAPWYDKAYAEPAPVDDPILTKILSSRDGNKAVSAAYDIADNSEFDPLALGFVKDADGNVHQTKALSWEALDFVRQGIYHLLDEKRNPLTGKLNLEGDPLAQSRNHLLTRLTARMDDLNPAYAEARSQYEKGLMPRDFFRRGKASTEPKIDEATVQRTMGDISKLDTPEEQELALQSFRQGFATELQNKVYNSGADGYNAVFGTPRQQAKMGLIGVNPEDFARQAELERQMAKTGSGALSGAEGEATAAANETLKPSHLGAMALETGLSGAPLLTGANVGMRLAYNRGLWDAVKERTGAAFNRGLSKNAGEIAPDLMGTDPAAALARLQQAYGTVTARKEATDPVLAGSLLAGGALTHPAITFGSGPGYTTQSDPFAVGFDVPANEDEATRNRRRLEELVRQYNDVGL